MARETLKYHISETMQNKVRGIRLEHHDRMLNAIILCKYWAHYFHIKHITSRERFYIRFYPSQGMIQI